MRMFCCFSCVVLDVYAFLSDGMQKKKRLRCRRFWFCLGLYKTFLCAAGGQAPFASLRSAPPPHAWEAIRNGLKYKSLLLRLPRVRGSWRGHRPRLRGLPRLHRVPGEGPPPHSLRSATTGSFLAALREGIRPEMRVSRTLMATRMTAAGRGNTA